MIGWLLQPLGIAFRSTFKTLTHSIDKYLFLSSAAIEISFKNRQKLRRMNPAPSNRLEKTILGYLILICAVLATTVGKLREICIHYHQNLYQQKRKTETKSSQRIG